MRKPFIWSLLEQIDSKLAGCQATTSTTNNFSTIEDILIYPNPSSGTIRIKLDQMHLGPNENKFIVYNTLGQIVQTFEMNSREKLIHIDRKGVFYIVSSKGCKKIVIN